MEAIGNIFFHLPLLTALAVAAALCAVACGWAQARGLKLLRGVLAVVLALHLTVFLYAAGAYILFPYEGKSVVEGAVLYNAMGYMNGAQPYRAPSELPFTSMVYPPGHELALAGFMFLTGPSPAAARLLGLLCALGAAGVAGWVVWRRTRGLWPALLGAGTVLACYGVTGQWYEQIRCDAMVMFLCALGLALAERAAERNRLPVAAMVVLLLALFTKQVALFAPVAVLFLLRRRDQRMALLWWVGFVALWLAAFFAMQFWSGGWFAFHVLRVPFSAGWDLAKFDLASTFLGTAWLVFGAAAIVAAGECRAWNERTDDDGRRTADTAGGGCAATADTAGGGCATTATLWAYAFVLALPLCLLQSLKWGAALNAFIPLVPIMGVLFGLGFHRLTQRADAPAWLPAAATALAAMQFALLSYQPLTPSPRDYEAQKRISAWVRAAPGDAFVSVFSSQVYLNGKPYFGDDVTLGDLNRAGVGAGSGLVAAVREGRFSLMVLRPKLDPEDFAAAVRERYQPVERIPLRTEIARWPYLEVYVPKSAPWRLSE
jgi:hypothetical protein